MKLADRIKYKLMFWCRSNPYDIIIPNFYRNGYEMDLYKLTKSGYVVEYEIKISKSDFKADMKKGFKIWNSEDRILKHDIIKNGERSNRFFFVVPSDLIKPDEIPEYCGLIYYDEKIDRLDLIKNAKLLHKNKEDLSAYRELAMQLSFREDMLRKKLRYANHIIKINSTSLTA